MAVIVQKYGGASVESIAHLKAVARRIVERREAGDALVVVLSAMGNTTDELIRLAHQVTENPSRREMDMLLSTGEQQAIALLTIAIRALGHDAVSLTGWHSEIITDGEHSRAQIKEIRGERIRQELERGRIVIVAGFQGISEDDEDITTLGRGGSDTTAVALAAALGAASCELLKDVDGVHTGDPKAVPDARLIRRIHFDEMLELAASGAGVIQSRAIEMAKRFNLPVVVRSFRHDGPGTVIGGEREMEGATTTGVTHDDRVAKISFLVPQEAFGAMAQTFQSIANQGINIKLIIESPSGGGKRAISFIVGEEDADRGVEILEQVSGSLGEQIIACDKDVALVAIVGSGIASHSGVAARCFTAFSIVNNWSRSPVCWAGRPCASAVLVLSTAALSVRLLLPVWVMAPCTMRPACTSLPARAAEDGSAWAEFPRAISSTIDCMRSRSSTVSVFALARSLTSRSARPRSSGARLGSVPVNRIGSTATVRGEPGCCAIVLSFATAAFAESLSSSREIATSRARISFCALRVFPTSRYRLYADFAAVKSFICSAASPAYSALTPSFGSSCRACSSGARASGYRAAR